MDIHQIRCFKRVAELRSFTAAAKYLNITQPALSRQVQTLEDDLGTQLLLRTTRGVQPTAAGKVMMEMGGNLLDYMEGIRKAVASAATDPCGEVVIGLPPSISGVLVPCLLDECRASLPQVRIRIIEGLGIFIEEWLAMGRIDLAILTHRPNMTVSQTPLYEEDLLLVGRLPLSGSDEQTISFDAMSDMNLVMTRGFKDLISQQMPDGRTLQCEVEMDSISAIRNLLATTEMCTVLPCEPAPFAGHRAQCVAADVGGHTCRAGRAARQRVSSAAVCAASIKNRRARAGPRAPSRCAMAAAGARAGRSSGPRLFPSSAPPRT